MHTGFWWGDSREGDNLEDPCIKWLFKKRDGGYGLDSCGSVLGRVAGSYISSYEPSVSIK